MNKDEIKDCIVLQNRNGKRFHITLMVFSLSIVFYFLFKGAINFYSYLVIFYCCIVCLFLYRSIEIDDEFVYIKYPLRPFFKLRKRRVSEIRKVFFSLEEGALVYPNIKFWFGKFNFIEIRLDLKKDDLIKLLERLMKKTKFKITCNKANRKILDKICNNKF